MTLSEHLLCCIAEDTGMDMDSLLESATFDSVCPGICTLCHGTVDYCEPDADSNWCESCDTHTVKSALVLAGVV